jgi:PAS domain-containing protein
MINCNPNRLCSEFPEIFQNYLDQVSRIIILLLDPEKNILDCNQGFLNAFGLDQKPAGSNLSAFMASGDFERLDFPEYVPLKPPLRGAVHGLVNYQESDIHFLDRNSGKRLLHCCVFNLGTHLLLFGENA